MYVSNEKQNEKKIYIYIYIYNIYICNIKNVSVHDSMSRARKGAPRRCGVS